jgi:hypothetical protein
MVFKIA